MRNIFLGLYHDEAEPGIPAVANLVAVVGAIILAVGTSGTKDVVTILGDVILAVRHTQIDYGVYERLDRLENSAPDGN